MIPPVDEAVLQSNPDFAILYTRLTKTVLKPDGSTKEDPVAKEREAVQKVSETETETTIEELLQLKHCLLRRENTKRISCGFDIRVNHTFTDCWNTGT
jgi:hypothetical protein